MKKIIIFMFSVVLFGSCEETSTKNSESLVKIESKQNLKNDYSLSEAFRKKIVTVSANGNGTFKNLQICLKNISKNKIIISVPAGQYFVNPDNKAQSLIVARNNVKKSLDFNQEIKFNTTTLCTSSRQSIPGFNKGWKYNTNYIGGLDEVIKFYGKFEKGINKWLKKKNSKFSKEENRLLFFQTVIWLHEGGQYLDILNMIAMEVFYGDIKKAKIWLDEIYEEAVELSKMIKERNSKKIKKWIKEKIIKLLPSSEKINNSVDNGKKKLNNLIKRYN